MSPRAVARLLPFDRVRSCESPPWLAEGDDG